MINPLHKAIIPEQVRQLETVQYQERLLMSDTVPANSETLSKVTITNLGHFYSLWLTGNYETLKDDGTDIVDDGINHLRGKLIDGANQRQLFNDFIPFDLFLSPGRVRSSNVSKPTDDSPYSNNLFYPLEFVYFWEANSEIQMQVKNDSNTDISFNIMFHGIRVKSAAAVAGLKR